jgi:hypothetical protein
MWLGSTLIDLNQVRMMYPDPFGPGVAGIEIIWKDGSVRSLPGCTTHEFQEAMKDRLKRGYAHLEDGGVRK